MNNATLETMTAERDSLRAAFIRYIALDQFIGCGCNPDDFDAHFENMQDALRGGAMSETVSSLSSSIEDVVFDVLNECETFRPKPSNRNGPRATGGQTLTLKRSQVRLME